MAKKEVLLSKKDLISRVAENTDESSKTVSKIFEETPAVLISTLLANKPEKDGDYSGTVPVPGIGSIAIKKYPACDRKNNFCDGKMIHIPAHYSPAMQFSGSFKAALNPEAIKSIAESKVKASTEKETTKK